MLAERIERRSGCQARRRSARCVDTATTPTDGPQRHPQGRRWCRVGSHEPGREGARTHRKRTGQRSGRQGPLSWPEHV